MRETTIKGEEENCEDSNKNQSLSWWQSQMQVPQSVFHSLLHTGLFLKSPLQRVLDLQRHKAEKQNLKALVGVCTKDRGIFCCCCTKP
jgi:hypothetical protein